MWVPAQGVPLSVFLFGNNKRKPELQTPVLFPLKVYRHPEGVLLKIYDTKAGLTFDDVKIKDPVITIDLDENMEIAYKLQFHPGKHLQRISDSVEEKVCEFECEAQQEELFGQAEEEDEDAPPPQGQLLPAGPASRARVPESNEDLGAIPGQDEDEGEDDDDE